MAGKVGFGTARQGMLRRVKLRYGRQGEVLWVGVCCGVAGCGKAGEVRSGLVRSGELWQGEAGRGMAG